MSRWMRCRGIVGIGVVGMMIVVACSAPTESEEGEVLRPGKFYRFGPNVLAPDTVQVGQSFEVIILTQGDGCYRKGVSKVRLSPDEVIIRPYDYVDTTPETCARVLRVFEHEVEGEFAQSGEGKVVVWGVDPTYFHPVRLEHVIVVVGSDP